MDELTIEAYDRSPERYATDWHTQPPPSGLYDLLTRYFQPGPTADVGCGAGRDTAWLQAHGFEAVGFDVSQGLVAEARRRYPGTMFYEASLPELSGISDGVFENVLCETVISAPARPGHPACGAPSAGRPEGRRDVVPQLASDRRPGPTTGRRWAPVQRLCSFFRRGRARRRDSGPPLGQPQCVVGAPGVPAGGAQTRYAPPLTALP